MPYHMQNPDQLIRKDLDFGSAEYDYDYPNDLDLRPTSELHNSLVARLLRYAWESARITTQRHPVWDEIGDKLTGYIKLSDKEKALKLKDPRKPVSIVFPYSYAILETLVSYMVSAFFPEPMFRYEGTGPEDIAGALLLQKVIELHVARSKAALNLHTMFRDAGAYGIGILSPQWTEQYGTRIEKRPEGYYDADGEFQQTGFVRSEVEALLYEGNSLVNVDPYCYLPDPNYPIHDVQKGEYVGWMDRSSYMDLRGEELNDPDDLFNVRYLQRMNNKSSSIIAPSPSRAPRNKRLTDTTMDRNVSDPIDQFHVYVKLIPSEWQLGDSDRPQKWLFTLAGDAVIIRAKPIGLHHNQFPVVISAPDFDGYSPVAYSRLEIISGLQTTMDFLFNSHVANVRKAINDMIIVDPFLLNMEDLRNPEEGALIRLRRPAWGRGVENVAKQLAVVDITRNNLQDVAFTIQYMQQIMGTDNPQMGNLRQGGPERLTTAEFQGTTRGAISRLERIARVIGLQAMQDIGFQFASNTQQLMTEETYVRTIGEWPEVIQRTFSPQAGRVLVSPNDILVHYDMLVRDGSIPGGNFNDAWVQIFQTIGNSEILIQRFDIVRIFKYIATQLGAKNVEEFELQPQQVAASTAPDEAVMREVERGNLVPV